MTRDQVYAHAVQLAAGFVANGDIRLADSVREDNQNIHRLRDLIHTLYETVKRSYDDCTADEDGEAGDMSAPRRPVE